MDKDQWYALYWVKKGSECTKPSDVIQMSNFFAYLQRKEEKQSLEIHLKTNQKEEPY
jgi:hypothetical protein